MTDETRKQWDDIIDALHLMKATGMTREELHKNIETVAVMMDLTTVLADVIDSMLLDIDDLLAKVKTPLDDRDRSYFKEMRKLVNAARKWAQRATRETRYSERDGDLATESDWWKNFILMAEDRTGTDELKTKQLIRWVSTMPSQLHLFDSIHTKDFLRLTDEYDPIPRKD
jgi:hypothetical protein